MSLQRLSSYEHSIGALTHGREHTGCCSHQHGKHEEQDEAPHIGILLLDQGLHVTCTCGGSAG